MLLPSRGGGFFVDDTAMSRWSDGEGTSMAVRGRYALIQYVPNRSRMEGVNVALLLFEVESGRYDVCIHLQQERLQAVAGASANAESVQAALNTLLARMREGESLTPAQQVLQAQRVIDATGLPFLVVPARGVRIDDFEEAAERMTRELLHAPGETTDSA